MNVIATAYDKRLCGYYKNRQDASGFPNYKNIVKEFIDWGDNISKIENTTTYAPSSTTTEHNTYYADGYHDTASGESVLVLWKEMKTNKGDVYGLSRGAKPGSGTVTVNNVNVQKYIPGFPIYFWFRPQDNKLIALLFEHSEKGKMNLEHFLAGFLRNKARPYVLKKVAKVVEGKSVIIDGFSVDGKPENLDELVYERVKFDICKTGNNLQLLLNNLKDIRRLKRVERATFSGDPNANKTPAERYYSHGVFEGLLSSPRILSRVTYSSEITWKPDEQEVRTLYDNALDAIAQGCLENLTAITNTGKRISFLGNAVSKEATLNNVSASSGYIKAKELFDALNIARPNLP